MSTTDVGNGLVAKVRAGDNDGARSAYYHKDIVSVEPIGNPREVKGIDACHKKGQQWVESMEVHSGTVEGPFVAGNQFAVRYIYDVTHKASKQRMTLDEMALYWVDGDKIVKEQFFYHMPGA